MTSSVPVAGVLHTVAGVAVGVGQTLDAAGVRAVHVVEPWLLAESVRAGAGTEVAARIGAHLRDLADLGADAILVTCSSIGEAAERASASVEVPVLRIDGPMAAKAVTVAAGGATRRVAVVATLASTLGPTARLVRRSADGAGASGIEVVTTLCEGAFDARAEGRVAEHDAAVRSAVDDARATCDVVVLAQASMAEALGEAGPGVPVLTSPRSGVAALLTHLDVGTIPQRADDDRST